MSGGLWGNWCALEMRTEGAEKCKRKVRECARLICSAIENGGKGVYFSATDKNPP